MDDMVKAVLFDFDDTLITTFETKSRAVQDFGKYYYNKDISLETIRKSWAFPFRDSLAYLFDDVDTIDAIMEKYMPFRKKYPAKRYPDALAVINTLAGKYKIGIVSSSSREALHSDLLLVGFAVERFFYIQTSEDTSVHKPDPLVFHPILSVLEKHHIQTNETVYIGDGISDYLAARGAGLSFFGLHGRTTPKEVFAKHGARSVGSLSDVLPLLGEKYPSD